MSRINRADWTKERIMKDALECFYNNKTLVLRMPEATRPWQHVIEPLFGYIFLVQTFCSKKGKKYVGRSHKRLGMIYKKA